MLSLIEKSFTPEQFQLIKKTFPEFIIIKSHEGLKIRGKSYANNVIDKMHEIISLFPNIEKLGITDYCSKCSQGYANFNLHYGCLQFDFYFDCEIDEIVETDSIFYDVLKFANTRYGDIKIRTERYSQNTIHIFVHFDLDEYESLPTILSQGFNFGFTDCHIEIKSGKSFVKKIIYINNDTD